jgi:hypothetical protein
VRRVMSVRASQPEMETESAIHAPAIEWGAKTA